MTEDFYLPPNGDLDVAVLIHHLLTIFVDLPIDSHDVRMAAFSIRTCWYIVCFTKLVEFINILVFARSRWTQMRSGSTARSYKVYIRKQVAKDLES